MSEGIYEKQWDEMLERLKAHYKEKGSFDVPQGRKRSELDADELQLFYWINTQRRAYVTDKLSEERIERLEAIGFELDIRRARFRRQADELREYQDKFNEISPKHTDEKHIRSARWVNKVRRAHKLGKLDPWRTRIARELSIIE